MKTEKDKLAQLNQIKDDAILLHDANVIDQSLEKLAKSITHDYADKQPVFLVVMNGGLVFAGNLLPKLNFPAQLDYCHATRYRGEISGGEIEWKTTSNIDLNGRHVVIIDDILDEGYTLQAVIQDCINKNVASVKTCILIEKLHDRKAVKNMRPDYCELTTPDQYVFGFGMDCNHYWRNCDSIYILNSDI